jgi:hypothetical protein
LPSTDVHCFSKTLGATSEFKTRPKQIKTQE